MTATTYTHLPGRKSGTSFGAWLIRIFERIVEAQALRVRGQVFEQLRSMSDGTLKEIGFKPAAINRLRKGEWVEFPG